MLFLIPYKSAEELHVIPRSRMFRIQWMIKVRSPTYSLHASYSTEEDIVSFPMQRQIELVTFANFKSQDTNLLSSQKLDEREFLCILAI